MKNLKNNSEKKQTRRVGVAGGFINQMMGNNKSTPIVGEGATQLSYSDRHAFEVIEVSNDGNNCVIREMDTTFVGSAYGDERYTYKSNENNYTKNLEWNDKKQCWGQITYTVQIIKSLFNKLYSEFGYDVWNNLPNGLKSNDLYEKQDDKDWKNDRVMKQIKGLTKQYKNFHKISILFGTMEEYRDPSF